MTLAFALHIGGLQMMGYPMYDNLIIAAYVSNYLLAFGIYLLLFALRNKMTAHLGFLYMGGSFLKFTVFFIFFYPTYKSDQNLSTLEFTSFFVPYAISLIYETIGIIKFLKK